MQKGFLLNEYPKRHVGGRLPVCLGSQGSSADTFSGRTRNADQDLAVAGECGRVRGRCWRDSGMEPVFRPIEGPAFLETDEALDAGTLSEGS